MILKYEQGKNPQNVLIYKHKLRYFADF